MRGLDEPLHLRDAVRLVDECAQHVGTSVSRLRVRVCLRAAVTEVGNEVEDEVGGGVSTGRHGSSRLDLHGRKRARPRPSKSARGLQ